uniref:Uncharacterized protein n=1 Tax=Candidatus Caldatribacterium saccharofermentans TaxID=1454753 RepID=A0A7V4TJA4_9BACT
MKWFVILGAVVCLLFVGAVAWAEEEIPNELTPEEQAELARILGMGPDDSTNTVNVDIPGAQCIYPKGAWAVITKPYFFSCNLDPCAEVQVKASVAQWVTLSLSATEIKWYVLKPGCYDTKWLFGCLTSNGDVDLVFSGFEDLKKTDEDKTIPTYYKYWHWQWGGPWPQWVRASNFNGTRSITEPIFGYVFRIYNKIEVSHLTPACEYEDPNGATICVTLKEQKTWVKPS